MNARPVAGTNGGIRPAGVSHFSRAVAGSSFASRLAILAIERGPFWLSLAAAIVYAPFARRSCNRGHHWYSILARREVDSYIGEVYLWRRCFWCRSLRVEPATRYAPQEPALRPVTRTPA